MRSATVFALIAVMVLGIYILPSVTAKFAGSHSWEVNTSTGVGPLGLKCGRCHIYIIDEFRAAGGVNTTNFNTGSTDVCASYNVNQDVVCAHINASRSASFACPTCAVNITADSTRDDETVCHLCHVVELGATVGRQHTRVTVRVCTDCHGNSTSVGRINSSTRTSYLRRVNCSARLSGTPDNISNCDPFVVGPRLGSPDDLHSNFFNPLEALDSGYVAESTALDARAAGVVGGNYTSSWYACLGCHTHVGVQMALYRSVNFNFSLISEATNWSAQAITRNTTAINVTQQFADAFPRSKWY